MHAASCPGAMGGEGRLRAWGGGIGGVLALGPSAPLYVVSCCHACLLTYLDAWVEAEMNTCSSLAEKRLTN